VGFSRNACNRITAYLLLKNNAKSDAPVLDKLISG
jgi:hypothetical protein